MTSHDPDAPGGSPPARAADGQAAPDDPSPPPLGVPAVAAEAVARRKPTVWSALWRYGVIGGSGVVVNLAALHLLHLELGLGFTRSSAIATEAAIVWNYLGNELWTFHHRRLALRRLLKFNASALAGLVATVSVATAAAAVVHPLAAQALGIAGGAALNFGLNFLWTWRR